ncbi:MAG: hypothetical protein V2B18_18195, partial [Pseudomonadota bacterium]
LVQDAIQGLAEGNMFRIFRFEVSHVLLRSLRLPAARPVPRGGRHRPSQSHRWAASSRGTLLRY